MDKDVNEPGEFPLAEQDVPSGSDGSPSEEDDQRLCCERCGAPARVHIVAGYVDGRPVRLHLCHVCADTAYELHLSSGTGHARPRPRVSSLIIMTGLLFAVLGASADLFGIEGGAGFGWKQQTGVTVGALLIVLGALLRVDALAVVGSILFAIAALADVQGTLGTPGMGWRQRVVIAAGLVLVLGGLHLRHRGSPRHLPGAG